MSDTKTQALDLLDRTVPPHQVALRLEVSVEEIWGIMLAANLKDWGRPEYYPFILTARTRDWPVWHAEDTARIEQARRDHDAGTLSLMQAVNEERIIQYAFPEKTPVVREPWFFREELY